MNEVWKSLDGIVEHGENYEISNLGRLRNKKQVVKSFKENDADNYYGVNLYSHQKRKYYSVHRLVALAFIPNPEGKPLVNHKDGVKSNNTVDNLEWATNSENMLHAYNTGLTVSRKGEQIYHLVVLTEEQVIEIKKLLKTKMYSQKKIAEMFGVRRQTINDINCGRTWKHVEV